MLQPSMRSLLLSTLLLLFDAVPPAQAASAACESRNNNTPQKLLECVTLEGVRAHQAALQAIADANGGDRFAASQGYVDYVDYVVGKLEGAGYAVTAQPFPYTTFFRLGPSPLAQVPPSSGG